MTDVAVDTQTNGKAEAEIVQRTRIEANVVWNLRIGAAMAAALVWLGIQTYKTNGTLSEHGKGIVALQANVAAMQETLSAHGEMLSAHGESRARIEAILDERLPRGLTAALA